MIEKTVELLKEVVGLSGVSGREEESALRLCNHFARYCDEVYVHPTQSVVGILKANCFFQKKDSSSDRPKRLMMMAHLDQIGICISRIEEGGFLRITGIGYDPKILIGQSVVILGKKRVSGIVSIRNLGKSSAKEQEITMSRLFIDTGLPEKKVREWICVGDLAHVSIVPVELKNGFFSSPFLDDRACVVALILAMRRLAKQQREWDLYFVASAGEESTGKGAYGVTASIEPDYAIATDVTFANQPKNRRPHTFECGEGLVLSVGAIYDARYNAQLEKIAASEKIKLSISPDLVGFGTDAASIREVGAGVPVGLVSLPLQNMHTPVELISLSDLEELGRFFAAVGSQLKEEQPYA